MNNLFEYYFIDWVGMALCLVSVYMLGNKNRWGFIVFAISNVIWIYLGLAMMSSIGMAAGNFVFMIINIRGFVRWVKLESGGSLPQNT